MRGAITGRDVVLHSVTIVRLFGVTRYLGCLWAALSGKPTTFLGSLQPLSTGATPRWRPSR